MSLLHFLELFFLASSAVVLGLGLQRLDKSEQVGRSSRSAALTVLGFGLVLALGFFAVYLLKILTLPILRYPESGAFRGTYLLLLIIHASFIPLSFGTGFIALILVRLKRRIRMDSWIRAAVALWIVAAASGTISAALLWRAHFVTS